MQSHGIPRVAATTLDKSEQARNKERKQIIQYQALERDVVDRVKAKDYSDTTFQLTSQLLTQNPEYYTIWNYRRLVLQHVPARELAADEEPSEQDAAADSSRTQEYIPTSPKRFNKARSNMQIP
ncbi:Rab geranylgeranyltransferase [Friedmanniomyces endolithicus]|nr:Rab geranylgeranyltransferase [Friedmanniomyces endolithicus]